MKATTTQSQPLPGSPEDQTLFRYALRRVRNADLAEELVQEARLAALKSKSSFKGESAERTWQMGILKHKIADYFRRSGRERPLTDVELDPEKGQDLFEIGVSGWSSQRHAREDPPSAAVERAEFWANVSEALAGLPPRIAEAFRLREVEQLPHDEICAKLDVTPANYWVMLHRARKKLQNSMTARGYGPKATATEGEKKLTEEQSLS